MTVSRRSFMLGLAAGAAAVSGCAGTSREPIKYRLGLSQPLDSPNYLRLKEMADRVRADTNGAMQIEVIGASKLGSDNQMIAMVQKGVEQLGAKQEEMARNIATLQAAEQDIRSKLLPAPQSSKVVPLPPRKKIVAVAPAQPASPSSVEPSPSPHPTPVARPPVSLHPTR